MVLETEPTGQHRTERSSALRTAAAAYNRARIDGVGGERKRNPLESSTYCNLVFKLGLDTRSSMVFKLGLDTRSSMVTVPPTVASSVIRLPHIRAMPSSGSHLDSEMNTSWGRPCQVADPTQIRNPTLSPVASSK